MRTALQPQTSRESQQLATDQHRRTLFTLLAALGSGASFFAISYWILTVTHPADDAYILFHYVRNTAAGHGIVFNVGGPRTEGATDFLWFLLLVAAVRLGADVALAAAALNALGAALAGWLLGGLCWGDARPNWARALLCAVLPAVFLTGGALAAYFGFSSMLYSALTLLLFAIAVEARGRAVLAIPVLGLTLALFRPDGAIVGAAFVLIGLWAAQPARLLGRYLTTSTLCAVVGLLYFAWRWNYFGLPLPLPLYVKQYVSADATGWWSYLPGLRDHWRWLMDPQGPKLILVGLAALLVYARFWHDAAIKRMLVFLFPLAGLLAALAFALQSQNVQWRFQAPVQLVLVYSLLYVAGRAIHARPGPASRCFVVVLAVAVVAPSYWAGLKDVRLHLRGAWNVYLEAFAPRFGPYMSANTVIALTEAGIVPYFTRARVVDMVGLNSADMALRPRSVSYVRALDPDMVFFNHAGTLDNDTLTAWGGGASRVVSISPEALRQSLRPSHRGLIQRKAETYAETGLQMVEYAAVLLTQFLIESADYEILSVDFKGDHRYVHVYGLKKDWPLRTRALHELHSSMRPENYPSYLRALENPHSP